MRLRDATRFDIAQMRQLEQESSSAAHWSESQYQTLFDPGPARRLVRVAQDESGLGKVQGFLIAHIGDEWEIENVVVDPSVRRQGIGSSLVCDLLSAARAEGVLNVLLEVRESNATARRFYEMIGFMPEGRRKDYYRNPSEDAILYRFSLQFCDKIS